MSAPANPSAPRSVAVMNYFYDEVRSPEALIDRYRSTNGVWEAVARDGVEVTVFQRFGSAATIDHRGVRYQFVADRHRTILPAWMYPRALHHAAIAAECDVYHINSYFPLQSAILRRQIRASAAIVHQDHAALPRTGLRRLWDRALLRHADGFVFVSGLQGAPWAEAGVIRSPDLVHEAMEGSTGFTPERTGKQTPGGMEGDPTVLWVGRLNHNKDPLVALAGFREALRDNPRARLYIIAHETDLADAVRAQIEADSLQDAVQMPGAFPHEAMEDWYRAADYFLLGSHKEGSGFALAEAMACGVVPVVTDIPSFRKMTGDGRAGYLWEPGNAASCAAALRRAFAQPRDEGSRAARAQFEAHLSFDAIARDLLKAYGAAVERRMYQKATRPS